MIRTQVQLTGDQAEALHRLSTETGKSVAELVRLGVELYLSSRHRPSRKEQVERALQVTGRFASGVKDISRNHDRYLSEAFLK